MQARRRQLARRPSRGLDFLRPLREAEWRRDEFAMLHSQRIGRIDVSRTPGIVSATVIVMLVTGAFGGGLIGLILGSMLTSQLWLAIIAAFAGVIIAAIVRHVAFGSRGQLPSPLR